LRSLPPVGAPVTGTTPACSPCRGEHHGGGGLTSGEPERWRCHAPMSHGGVSGWHGSSSDLVARRAAPPHQGHVARVVHPLSEAGRGQSSGDHGDHDGEFTGGEEDGQKSALTVQLRAARWSVRLRREVGHAVLAVVAHERRRSVRTLAVESWRCGGVRLRRALLRCEWGWSTVGMVRMNLAALRLGR
jgi:hypothetical protein